MPPLGRSFRHFHQHLKGLFHVHEHAGDDERAALAESLLQFAAHLRRQCATGRITSRFGRGNALGLATVIETLVRPPVDVQATSMPERA